MTKKITIGLNLKDVQEARQYLLQLKKNVPKMENEMLESVANYIVRKANANIFNADLGSLVKSKLIASWHIEKTTNGINIVNDANIEKTVGGERQTVPLAILVEFGVGIVGEQNPHPYATNENYEYNVDSGSKDASGLWSFYTNSNELDLPRNSFVVGKYFTEQRGKDGEKGNRMIVATFGTKGVWYAYNAIIDAQIDLRNPNGELQTEFKKIVERYLK